MHALESTERRAPMSHEIQVLCSLSHTFLILLWALPSKVFIMLFQQHTLNRKHLCVPHTHSENLCGHHHPDPFAGLNVSLRFQVPFSSSQTHQFISCCLDKVLFSGTSTPQAVFQWSCLAPHVTLHLHLKLTRLFHSHRYCFTPLPPTNSTEMSSSAKNSESRHDRSTAF